MAYTDTRIATLLPILVARLQSKLTLTAATCHLGDADEVPKAPNPRTVHLIVGTAGGTFDEGMWDGGGIEQVVGSLQLVVSIFTHSALDQPGHDTQRQTHASYGLFPTMHLVLDALLKEGSVNYMPQDGSNNDLLREPIQPLGWEGPYRLQQNMGQLKVKFQCLLDWDF